MYYSFKNVGMEQSFVIYEQTLKCDCGGDFVPLYTNRVLLSYPEKFIYECNKCKSITHNSLVFPRFILGGTFDETENT